MAGGDFVGLAIGVIAICAIAFVAAPIAITALIIRHRQRMAEIKSSPAGESAAARLQALCDEVANLRETTTRYDISVESSLVEIRRRLAALESLRDGRAYKDEEVDNEIKLKPRFGG